MGRLPVLILLLLLGSQVLAQFVVPAQETAPRYLARIELHKVEELQDALDRADTLFNSGNFVPGQDQPVAFILHGPEALALLKANYSQNKSIVDLAARLSAFKVVDIQVCETWMGNQLLSVDQLPPFIGTIPYGPQEKQRMLKEEGYVYF